MSIISKETNMEDYVTYEQALRLKELGFDWKCLYWYHPNEDDKTKRFRMSTEMNHNFYKRGISAPTLSQAQKWLREVKNTVVLATCNLDYEKGHEWYWFVDKDFDIEDLTHVYETYEKALSAGIDKALELLK